MAVSTKVRCPFLERPYDKGPIILESILGPLILGNFQKSKLDLAGPNKKEQQGLSVYTVHRFQFALRLQRASEALGLGFRICGLRSGLWLGGSRIFTRGSKHPKHPDRRYLSKNRFPIQKPYVQTQKV